MTPPASKRKLPFGLIEAVGGFAFGFVITFMAAQTYDNMVNSASDLNDADRALAAQSLIETWASTNKGRYPTSKPDGALSQLWQTQRIDTGKEAPPAQGASIQELPPVVGQYASKAAAEAGDPAFLDLKQDPARAHQLIYASITPGPKGDWLAVREARSGKLIAVHRYVVGTYDHQGRPWFVARGGI